MTDDLRNLIAATHGAGAAAAHGRYELSGSHQNAVGEVGREILSVFPWMPGACVMMSAVFAGQFEARTGHPSYVVAGSLHAGSARVFGDDAPIDGARRFGLTDPSWNGHVWAVLGPYVIDLSIFRTAYSPVSPPALASFVREKFGERRGMLMMRSADAAAHGLDYRPQYVLDDTQVAGLIGGAMTLVPR